MAHALCFTELFRIDAAIVIQSSCDSYFTASLIRWEIKDCFILAFVYLCDMKEKILSLAGKIIPIALFMLLIPISAIGALFYCLYRIIRKVFPK